MKQHTTQAIILKRINFGEADRILTLITSDFGKMSVLAKGARRSKSKLAGGLELFSVSDISFIDGRSELKTLVSTRLETHFGKIVGDIKATMMAYDFLKMIDDSTRESCGPEYFELIKNCLEALNEQTGELDCIYVWYVSRLLEYAGSSINLEKQVDGSEFSEDYSYQFSVDDQAFFAHTGGSYTSRHIKFLRLLSKVTTPAHLIRVADSDKIAKDLKPMLDMSYQNS